ncbi:MAG TPA: DUF4126 family protein [Candidatus Acidoferrales bacterium]
MSSSLILALAFAIGVIAGLRAFTAPGVICWAAHLGWITLHGSHLAFLGSTVTVVIVTPLAIFELVNDKLPATPNRTTPGPLGARIVMGALCGAALAIAGGQGAPLGAIAGIVGAVVGAFGGYQTRRQIGAQLKVKDFGVALLEDLIAIGGALLVVTRF